MLNLYLLAPLILSRSNPMLLVSQPIDPTPVKKLKPAVSSGVLGILIFIATEVMFFSGLISSFFVIRADAMEWPPWGQPRLPVEITAFNTFALILSAVATYYSYRSVLASQWAAAKKLALVSIFLGSTFLVIQGFEWIQLIQFGLTMTSSIYGAIFYLIIGAHGLHVMGGLLGMITYGYIPLLRNSKEVSPSSLLVPHLFWYFVVGVWPLLYFLIYLL